MTYTEIIDLIQRYTGTQSATTSSYPLAAKTTDVNNALNKLMLLAINAEGRWNVDDSNHLDYPIIFGDISAGVQDYAFTVDEEGNQILDIYKVRITNDGTNWTTLRQVGLQEGDDYDLNSTVQGIPTKYRLTGNGIFLTDIPNFTREDSLEIYINRTPSYFTTSDTTKKAGIPWNLHEYLAIRPAYYYCMQKGLKQANNLRDEMLRFEDLIEESYSKRNKDEPTKLKAKYRSSR